MATKVIYKQGTKETYLGLLTKNPNALYFCTDTKGAVQGDDLYSDGLRFVESASTLPKLLEAADGVIYLCKNSGSGYVLKEDRSGWTQVIYAPDNETVAINADGLIGVKAVPIAKVTGLEDKLSELEQKIEAGGTGGVSSPATHETAGVVKPSEEFALDEDGAMSVESISAAKVSGLEDLISSLLDTKLVWESMDE